MCILFRETMVKEIISIGGDQFPDASQEQIEALRITLEMYVFNFYFESFICEYVQNKILKSTLNIGMTRSKSNSTDSETGWFVQQK